MRRQANYSMKNTLSNLKTRIVIILTVFVVAACASPHQDPGQTDLKNLYNAAIEDAAIAEKHEISKNLVAIVPSNNDLIWKNKDAQEPYVLVVTWTDYDGYDGKVGQSTAAGIDIWVTVVPEVQDFCRNLPNDPALRLEQVLGLPLHSEYDKFVELWVKPVDLFRPSADPEISDSEAEIDFRISNKFMKLSDQYIRWFNDQKKVSYRPGGYPWTRLGYTYDWGNPHDHVGLSEFIINKGAVVEINSISPTAEYCR